MAFEPFGYRFEVRAQMPLADAKAAIRKRKKRWFEAKNGPRGWIIGPFVCLWLSAFDRYGPMLIGWISQDGFGTQIRGQAGSDLNGLLAAAVILPLLAWLLFYLVVFEGAPMGSIIVPMIVLLLAPTAFWFGNKDKHDADPLVRFVRRTLGEEGPGLSSGRRVSGQIGAAKLLVGGTLISNTPKDAEIENAVDEAQYDVDRFVILERDEQHYVQAALRNGGLILEKREGSADKHFAARRSGAVGGHALGAKPITEPASVFTPTEVQEALIDYLHGSAEQPWLAWERLKL
jgi:hypothetical protein